MPLGDLIMRTTGLRIPGTAAEASTADQMTQFGAVKKLARMVGECGSEGTQDTLRIRPVRS